MYIRPSCNETRRRPRFARAGRHQGRVGSAHRGPTCRRLPAEVIEARRCLPKGGGGRTQRREEVSQPSSALPRARGSCVWAVQAHVVLRTGSPPRPSGFAQGVTWRWRSARRPGLLRLESSPPTRRRSLARRDSAAHSLGGCWALGRSSPRAVSRPRLAAHGPARHRTSPAPQAPGGSTLVFATTHLDLAHRPLRLLTRASIRATASAMTRRSSLV